MREQFQYEDLGLVFDPSDSYDTLRYSQVPTPIMLSEDVIRVYLAGRNNQNETFIYNGNLKNYMIGNKVNFQGKAQDLSIGDYTEMKN